MPPIHLMRDLSDISPPSPPTSQAGHQAQIRLVGMKATQATCPLIQTLPTRQTCPIKRMMRRHAHYNQVSPIYHPKSPYALFTPIVGGRVRHVSHAAKVRFRPHARYTTSTRIAPWRPPSGRPPMIMVLAPLGCPLRHDQHVPGTPVG